MDNLKGLIEVLDKVIEKMEEDNKEMVNDKKKVVISLFDNITGKGIDGFKEHIDNQDCMCAIEAYTNIFTDCSDEDIKEIKTHISRDNFEGFIDILKTRLDALYKKALDSIKDCKDVYYKTEIKNLEDMTKEELINYINKNNI